MEDLDEQLKTHIHSILNTAPEETVNGIVHALKHAGLESLSDLQFVQEEDLVLLLKPIQRRKLVKALNELNANDDNLSDIAATSVSSFTPPTQNKSETKNSVSITPPCFPSDANNDNLSDIAGTSVSSLTPPTQNKSETINSVSIAPSCFPSGANENNSSSIESASVSSYTCPSQNQTSNPVFIVPSYSSFYIPSPKIPNNLHAKKFKWKKQKRLVLLRAYAKYKKKLSSCPDVDKMKIWEKIAQEVQKKYFSNCDVLQCQDKIDELRCEYEKLKKQNVISRKRSVFFDVAKNAFEDVENSIILPYTVKSSIKLCNWTKGNQLMLLEAYAQYKTELSQSNIDDQEVWNKIAKEYESMSSISCDGLQCCSEINVLKNEFERLKNTVVTNRVDAWCLDKIRKYFENPTSSFAELPNAKHFCIRKRNKEFCLRLLQVYAKYDIEFASPDIEEKKVWEQIVTELREEDRFDCGESLCRFEIFDMKEQYENFKIGKIEQGKKPWFFEEAQKAFGSIENLVIPSAITPNDLSVQVHKLNKKKLLKVYGKYEAELSQPGVKEQKVWKKIAKDFKANSCMNYDKTQCCSAMDELRHEYERLKNDVVSDLETAMFLDKAKKYFEVTENQRGFSADETSSIILQCCKDNKEYYRKLLHVYTKYKAEFASPDTDVEKVWDKIVTELRESYLYDCGVYLCQFGLLQMKHLYEELKNGIVINGNMPYLFEEAQKAFENSENLDTLSYDVDKVKNSDECIPPDLRSTENKQNGFAMSAKTVGRRNVLKVSNLSEDVKILDLQELFEPFGTNFVYKVKDELDESKCFVFITFLTQEDATQALVSADGIEFNEIALKVEWAESSQTDENSKVGASISLL